MSDNELILAAIAKVETEVSRVRDSVHTLRSEVNSKIGALEVANAESKGQIAVLQQQVTGMKEKVDGYDRGIDRRFKEHEARLDDKIAALQAALEASIARTKDSVSDIRMTAKNWLVLFFAPFGFLVLQVVGKKLGWL